MSTTTFKQLVATCAGKNYHAITAVRELPLPTPTGSQILIRNHFAGINASDINITSGAYSPDMTFPLPIGIEGLGVVTACGPEVSSYQPGDKVLYLGMGAGAFSEYTVIDSEAGYTLKVNELDPALLSLMTGATTAAVGLLRVGELRKGKDVVLITGAAGATGQFAVQIAKRHGNHVIAVCGGDDKAALVQSLGADRVINYRREDVDTVLRNEYPRGIHLVYEGIGGKLFDTCVDHLAPMGRLLIVGYISEYQAAQPELVTQPRIYTKLLWKGASIRAFISNQYPREFNSELINMYRDWQAGTLISAVDSARFTGLDAVADAVDYLYSGKNTGKVVVDLRG